MLFSCWGFSVYGTPDNKGVELARFGGSLTVDNFEGLAVRGDDLGRLLVYMISDDNFSSFQRTLLMQFLLVY